ncbi:lysylphosphatidylglycerol synthase transmembrane domain-containing protein [Halorubrum laminariae]|uniref:YbhN family protein n=1 Tax=Halorubrum laminariae TaxID=1433523 RepID=A0ABD6C2Q4_9EURY|nr:lysylphosphatidylglycerol synthase transmembrane domain-containing protein [Halorubrum laminariae]
MTNRPDAARLRDRLTRGRLTLVGTGLVLAVGGWLTVRYVDVGMIVDVAAAADPTLLGVALVAYALSWPLRGRRYGDVLAAMGSRLRTGFLTAAVFASQTANLIVPARAGDGVRAYLLKRRRDVPYPTGAASLAVERAFDLVAIATLGALALAALATGDRSVDTTGGVTPLAAAAGLAAVAVVLAGATVAVARSDRQFGPALRNRTAETRLARPVDAAIRFGAAVRVVAARPRRLATVFGWSLLVWEIDVATAVLVLAALLGGFDGGLVALPVLLAVGTLAVSAGNLAKVLPLSQGGVGLYEAAFTGLVVGTTAIPVETAIAAAVLDHALKNAVTLAGGAAAATVLNVSPARSADEAPANTDTADEHAESADF